MRADIRLEGPHRDRIREALITGDFFVTPPRVVFDLEAALRGLDVGDAGRAIEDFFARTAADFLSLPSQTKRSSRSPVPIFRLCNTIERNDNEPLGWIAHQRRNFVASSEELTSGGLYGRTSFRK